MELPDKKELTLSKLEELGINQKELGKVLVIASSALLIVSLHAFYTFSSLETEMSEINSDMDQTVSLIESSQFNSSLEALRDVNAMGVSRKVNTIIAGVTDAKQSMQRTQNLVGDAGNAKETYQWLTLISILGLISGAVLFVMER